MYRMNQKAQDEQCHKSTQIELKDTLRSGSQNKIVADFAVDFLWSKIHNKSAAIGTDFILRIRNLKLCII